MQRILEAHNFRRGSHCIMQKVIPQGTITVPVPLHPRIRRGTLMSIIRQSGVPRDKFES
ncbi:MAG: type II toxin-antitoxin system HicA family toxin [Bryobacteraceae bacterium]